MLGASDGAKLGALDSTGALVEGGSDFVVTFAAAGVESEFFTGVGASLDETILLESVGKDVDKSVKLSVGPFVDVEIAEGKVVGMGSFVEIPLFVFVGVAVVL